MPNGPCRTITSIVLAAVICAMMLAPSAPRAQEAETFDIPAQDLASALRAFAVATGTEILYTPDLVANRRSVELQGEFTPAEALRRLLGNSGLEVESAASGVLVLKRLLKDTGNTPGEPVAANGFRVMPTAVLQSANAHEASGPGELAGVVRNAAMGTPLAGAVISVAGTGRQEVSDDRGRYRFADLSPGLHAVSVDWLGSRAEPIEVEVEPGRATMLDLEVGEQELETLVVLGYRSGIQRALNQQRTAPNSSTVVSADLLGGFPAETVSEALRRVPGVAFGRSDETGEGSRITIRGFSSEAINVQLNGLDLQGTGFERSIDLSGFLADNISQVTIHKSLLPSHEASGSGGLVEIETKSGLDYGDFQFNFGMEGERSLESGFGDEQQANALLARKVTDNFGIAATLQYRASDRRNYDVGIQSEVPPVIPAGYTSRFRVPASQQFPFDPGFNSQLIYAAGWMQRDRDEEDIAASINLAWDAAGHTRLRLDLQRNVRDVSMDSSRTSAGYLLGRFDMPVPELDGEIRRRMVLNSFRPSLNLLTKDVEVMTDTISFRGDTDTDRWQFDYKLGYSGAVTRSNASNLSLVANTAPVEDIIDPATMITRIDDDTAGTVRVADGGFIVLRNGVVVPSFSAAGNDRFLDLSQYNVNTAQKYVYDSPTDAYIAELSVRYETEPGFLQYVEGGLKYDRSSRDSSDDNFASPTSGVLDSILQYDDVFGLPTTLADLGGDLSLDQDLGAIGAGGFTAPFLSTADGEFIFDRLSSLLLDDPSTAFNEARFVLADRRGLDPIQNDTFVSPTSTLEEKFAGYVEAQVRFNDFDVTGGARVERTERTGTALAVPSITLNTPVFQREPRETFVNAGLVEFTSIRGTDTTVTPSILVNYRPTDNIAFRLGYFRSTVNPNFRLLRQRTQYFIDLRPSNAHVTVREGNPELKPSKTHNFDLDVAYYFEDTPGSVRAAVFYKDIDNNFTNVLTADLPAGDLRQRTLDYLAPLAESRPDLLELPPETEFLLSRPVNGEGGTIWGAELELIRQLDFLPGILSDFGVLANATYTDGDFPTLLSGFDEEGTLTDFTLNRPLADQAEWVYNASINYARGGFEGRLIYTYQSATVAAYEIHDLNLTVPEYSTLDLRLSYNFEGLADSVFTLFLEGDDLLRGSTEADIRYALEPTFGRGDADYSFPTSLQFNGGRTLTAGIRARF